MAKRNTAATPTLSVSLEDDRQRPTLLNKGEQTLDGADLRRIATTIDVHKKECQDLYKETLRLTGQPRDNKVGDYIEAQRHLSKVSAEAVHVILQSSLSGSSDAVALRRIGKLLCTVVEEHKDGLGGHWQAAQDSPPVTYAYQSGVGAFEHETFSLAGILDGLRRTLKDDMDMRARRCCVLATRLMHHPKVTSFQKQPQHGHTAVHLHSGLSDPAAVHLNSGLRDPTAIGWAPQANHSQIRIEENGRLELSLQQAVPSIARSEGVCFDYEKEKVVKDVVSACTHLRNSYMQDLILHEDEGIRFHVRFHPQGCVATALQAHGNGPWVQIADTLQVPEEAFGRGNSGEVAHILVLKAMKQDWHNLPHTPNESSVDMIRRGNASFLYYASSKDEPHKTLLAVTWVQTTAIRHPKQESTQMLKDALAEMFLSKINPNVLMTTHFYHQDKSAPGRAVENNLHLSVHSTQGDLRFTVADSSQLSYFTTVKDDSDFFSTRGILERWSTGPAGALSISQDHFDEFRKDRFIYSYSPQRTYHFMWNHFGVEVDYPEADEIPALDIIRLAPSRAAPNPLQHFYRTMFELARRTFLTERDNPRLAHAISNMLFSFHRLSVLNRLISSMNAAEAQHHVVVCVLAEFMTPDTQDKTRRFADLLRLQDRIHAVLPTAESCRNALRKHRGDIHEIIKEIQPEVHSAAPHPPSAVHRGATHPHHPAPAATHPPGRGAWGKAPAPAPPARGGRGGYRSRDGPRGRGRGGPPV